MIDLGGGSCELTISSKGHIRETVSLPLGAVRLTNDFLHHDLPRKSELRQLRSFITREVSRVAGRIAGAKPKVVIATWAPQKRWRQCATPCTAPRASAG